MFFFLLFFFLRKDSAEPAAKRARKRVWHELIVINISSLSMQRGHGIDDSGHASFDSIGVPVLELDVVVMRCLRYVCA